ncbi:hypothetical protein [Streptomyces griseus]|uniref:hypothetical protein n=1 Tax=Streptomyces griseus TaxID=1911 RepID=UPI00403D432C
MSPSSAAGEAYASLNDLAAYATVDLSSELSNIDVPVITFSDSAASTELAVPPQNSIGSADRSCVASARPTYVQPPSLLLLLLLLKATG